MPSLSRISHAFATRRRRAAAAVVVAAAVVAASLIVILAQGGPPRRPARAPSPTTPSSTAPRNAPAQPPPKTELFGANVGRLFNDRTYSPAQIGAQLAALRNSGATVARSDALWEATEPIAPVQGAHRYDWTFDDAIAGQLAAHGLSWLPIIDYSAPWAQSVPGQDHSPPASIGDYADYAAALASRYGPNGSFWAAHPGLQQQPVKTYEIWNEPDNPVFWSPAPDPTAYANLYITARRAIDAVQPNATVIVGGLTHPAAFTTALLAASPQLRGHIDGVGIHPYGATPQDVLASVRSARLALDSLGLGTVPLYVTEFGWTTHPPGALDWAPPGLRPAYIARTFAALGHLDCGVSDALLYAWVTPERNPANPQDWFGISPPGGGSTPDTVAFAEGLRAASSPAATIALCS